MIPVLLTGSIAFWSVVAYVAFKPHRTELPAMGPVSIERSRRNGQRITVETAPTRVIVERRPSLAGLRPRTPVAGIPARRALPSGAQPMPGRIGPVPLGPHRV